MERTKFFRRISKQLDGTNILDGFKYNANLDTGIQNINKNIKKHDVYIIYCQFYTFTQVDPQ